MNTSIMPPSNDLIDESDTVISIPVKKSDLGGFITDLLGQKQSLERTYNITFEIDHSWLVNLHETINQRISQQANSTLINFTAVIYFENGTKRTITSLEAFKGYNETKREVSSGVKIIWEYLIQFPNRPHPEKQQISFTASIYQRKKTKHLNPLDIYLETLLAPGKESLINVQIDHTERTWSDDIESIISTSVLEVMKTKSVGFHIAQFARLAMLFVIVSLLMIYPLYNALTVPSDSLSSVQEQFLVIQAAASDGADMLNQKLDLIFETLTQIEESKSSSTIALLIGCILTPAILTIFLVVTRPIQSSHVLLSQMAILNRDKQQKRTKGKVCIIILSYIGSIAAGIIGNYGFQFING
ncbi:hypothetical protein [Vibrio sp. 10N.222.55.B11]|uniref:hypothetical protein n=1 Tax=Vibrio sp. 10N.222.55.B11 TaxID=3229648 RepID=UPI00354FD718